MPGTDFTERYFLSSIDPHFTYLNQKGATHTFRSRVYNVYKYWDNENLNSTLTLGKYNYTQKLPHDITLLTGAQLTVASSKSNLFEFRRFIQTDGAAFAQVEKKFFDRLSVIAGTRIGFYQSLDSVTIAEADSSVDFRVKSTPVLPRLGINYQAAAGTFIRGSFGTTYRVPAFGEKFITEKLGDLIQLFPNPQLQPETGYGGELGIKQGIQIGKWRGFIDGAFFWNEFSDMINWAFKAKVEPDGSIIFGFQSENMERARVVGWEISGMGEGNIGKVPLRFFGGYTFHYAGNLAADTAQKNIGVYFKNLGTSISNPDSVAESMLTYRTQHQVRADLEFDLWKFTLGVNFSYNSFMVKVDAVFEEFVSGVADYREEFPVGNAVFNFRAAYQASDRSRFTLVVKNATNREYTIRPAMIEAPASVNLQYRYEF